ncbi:TIGR03943 family putative permease subunit [Streptomyces lanatus]|uniref:TIGR03943 family protein n=1 Tax=Streptomyces lanatus TaxID=66900 RepID=A0ABV1XLF6_9ACTN|nr:TIGR03943 family protein [Streptomyces lanatus]GHG98942.1 membrane protein [Streptomyces lanatus]
MKRPLQMVLLVLIGLGLLHASLFTDLCLRYVKEGMRPLVIASGVLLVLLGVAEALDVWSHRRPGGDDASREAGSHDYGDRGHGHDHSTAPHVAWLLLLPALSLLLYAPPALGAYTASREAPKVVTERDHFDPLPATSPVPLTLTDFIGRVQQDRDQAIKGRSVEMTGFVTPDRRGDGWYLTRTIFMCCAADAQFVKVRIHGSPAPPADTWVSVTGTWHPGGTLGTSTAVAALDARAVKRVDRPVNAYTDALPLAPSP